MGTISTGVGLISGINTAQLIESLLAIDARGKTRLQSRISSLEQQRTALLDINARLLNLKTSAKGFRADKIFLSTLATSSNEEVLTATAGTSAQPGSYNFIVKQLVSTSQQITRGFVDRDTTPLGLDQLSFEFGNGRLSVDRDLSELNGGNGIDRGRITITDRAGESASIDLRDVTTTQEVLDRINSASGVAVTATVEGNHLVLTDASGGAGNLVVENGLGDTTATDLGIAGSIAGTSLAGTDIFSLGATTALSSLNDGNGILIRDNTYDLRITARDGRIFEVDLGRIDAPIENATLLADLNNGSGITINSDSDDPDLKFVDRDGNEYEVDLTGVTTVGQLKSRVATATSGRITIDVDPTGSRFTVTDTVGGAGNLKVLGAGVNGDDTAEDLGIFNEAGVATDTLTGDQVPSVVSQPRAQTLEQVINRINNALDATETANGGAIVASIGADGHSLVITDATGGGGGLQITGGAGLDDGGAAADLGIFIDPDDNPGGLAANMLQGNSILGSLDSVLVQSINGGSGIIGSTLSLTDRNGNNVTVNDLDTFSSITELMSAVNEAASGAGVELTLSLNSAGNGLRITDASGGAGNLIVGGDIAASLGLETEVAGIAADSVNGTNLQLRYVDESTALTKLNYGRGVGTGSFKITDGFGITATISITSSTKTLQDVIANINSRNLAVHARVNDNGDGLIIEEDLTDANGATAFRTIKIESTSGSAATDLRILGESATIEGGFIDGSYERVVDLSVGDSLEDVLSKINAAGVPVSATIINSGSGATPYRLSITSGITGRAGELTIDSGDVDLGLSVLGKGQDAKVFFGSNNIDDAFLITSSTNQLSNVIQGVTIDLKQASESSVTLTINRDVEKIVSSAKNFVTTFNDAIGRIDQYDFFDVETEQRGVLLSNPTTSRVRAQLLRQVRGQVQGVGTQYQYLSQVGIRIGADGQVKFDDEKFRAAYANDPQAVENLFAAFEGSTQSTREIGEGITVTDTQQTYTTRGIGDIFDQMLDSLTNSIDGTFKNADRSIQSQIDLASERIELFDVRLQKKREKLQREFAAMEFALAQFQSQGQTLSGLASNVALASGIY